MTIVATSATAIGPTSGGKTYAYNTITTSPQVVAQANQNRVSITFHNPGSVGIWVAPSLVQNSNNTAPTTASDTVLTPSLAALGGCYYIYANGGQITFSGESQKAWQAFAASGTTNALTVSESNL